MPDLETPQRIEPAKLEDAPEAISDVIAELSSASATLGVALNPRTASNLADLVRLRNYVERSETLKHEAVRLLEEALVRGQLERGEISRIKGLPDRTARRVLNDVLAAGLLASETPKGPVSLRFPVDALEILFPRLFPET